MSNPDQQNRLRCTHDLCTISSGSVIETRIRIRKADCTETKCVVLKITQRLHKDYTKIWLLIKKRISRLSFYMIAVLYFRDSVSIDTPPHPYCKADFPS